ncbi:hypothetical protein [Lutibacter citreus]|uniref:hypothetical protein n=1 Tax=Lutibacter citreus TaxID=2138210 RepID=UPI000DBE5E82|nr:hypothetical protein [Lutibacter citreus]
MKKILNLLSQIVLAIITAITFLIITFFVTYKFSREIIVSLNPFPIYISSFLSFIFVLFFIKKKKYFYSTITILLLITLLNFLINNSKHNHSNLFSEHLTTWSNTEHTTTIPFYSSESGHIYLKAKIGNETKYIAFDTGAELCGFNEKYNVLKNDTLFIMPIIDSNGKKNKMKIHKLKNLSFGALAFKKNHFVSMSSDIWEKKCGIFYNQDSIAGVLGNNIINCFVWDFDMLNKTVSISEKTKLQNISKAVIIPLNEIDKKNWVVKIKINGEKKKVILDSGCDATLFIKDTLNISKNYKYLISSNTSKGLFSYKDCMEKNDSTEVLFKNKKTTRNIFVNLKIDNTLFKDILIKDSSSNNLLGVPLFWEFERVVLNFPNKMMYLFNKNNDTNTKSITNISDKMKIILEKN